MVKKWVKYDVTVTCDRGATAIWNEDTWSITIYNATKTGTRCSVSFVTNNNYKDGRYESTGSCISSGCEIWINNNSNFTTGCAGSSVSASSASSCNQWNTSTGINASTTGNIYGIYDMSGGAW